MSLALEEMQDLQSTVDEMRKLDVFQAGQIFLLLSNPLITNNSKLEYWVHNVKNSVYTANRKAYQVLIDQLVVEPKISDHDG